ncbi:phage head-tail joining protein [Oceanicella sp. SM1341]
MNGESVTFRSLTEMRATLRMIEEELAGAQGPSISVTYPRTTRGL